MQQLPLGVRLPDRAVFASFLPARNAQAVSYLEQIAAGSLVGTIWLCGPHGAGKTHLLQAACARASDVVGEGYVPLRELARLGVGVLDGMRSLGCLCLDDVDQVIGQIEWERELFSVFREIEEGGGRLLVAAEAPPALQKWALPDLGSRLAASSVFQLKVLDEAEQQAALQLR